MSQEQPNSQPPSADEPAIPPETSSKSQQQNTQANSNLALSPLKAQTVKLLRGAIRVLEGAVVKLEETPSNTRKAPGMFEQLQTGWRSVLTRIRALLPENLSSKLSDLGLTAIIAFIAALGVLTIIALLPEKPTEVAKVPTTTPPPEVKVTPSPELTPPVAGRTPPESVPLVPQPSEATPSPQPVPPVPQPSEATPSPESPTPAPGVELTPEQQLIASIQNQVAEITDEYADGLVQSIAANFQNSNLRIQVGNDWYNLEPSRQDKLAAKMLERAKELDFIHLEVTDPQGNLLARSPVIGNEMIILKRQLQQQT